MNLTVAGRAVAATLVAGVAALASGPPRADASVRIRAVHAATKSCQSVRDVVPTGGADIPATSIRATGVTCRLARSLPRRVILNFRYGSLNPDSYGAEALGIANWRCDPVGGYGKTTVCYSGSKRVSWRLGPSTGGT
jgi:hypothetical protein